MLSEPLNVAIVGCGIFGKVHAETYAKYPRCRLVAVCDLDGQRAERFAQTYGCRPVRSVDQIAADPQIQAVSVVTPDHLHRDVAVTLARAGKHILCEKPLATTVADAQAIADAVADAGVLAMIDLHNRYQPPLRAIKERLDRGELGRPQAMFVRLSDRIEVAAEWLPWASHSGPEWFLGAHAADLACWMFGRTPRRVFAEARRGVLSGRGIDCHDSMQMHLSFPAGFATVETSWIMPPSWPEVCDFYFSLQTTDARADMYPDGQAAIYSAAAERGQPLRFARPPKDSPEPQFFNLSIRSFVDAVLAGGPAPVPLEVGLNNVRVLAAAVESARIGRPVDLDV